MTTRCLLISFFVYHLFLLTFIRFSYNEPWPEPRPSPSWPQAVQTAQASISTSLSPLKPSFSRAFRPSRAGTTLCRPQSLSLCSVSCPFRVLLPIWIPTVKRSRARKLHDDLVDIYGSIIRRFKTLMDSGEEVPDCLVKMLIECQEDEKLDWEDLCMLSAVFTLEGVHSVSALASISMEISCKSFRHLGSSNGSLL